MKKQFTSKIFMALVAIGCCAGLSAQTVIKVGAGQGTKQKTIQMAYDSIVPSPMTGAYVLEIQSDYDATTETYPINLKAKTGASATNTITIKPATGVKKVIGVPNKTKIVVADITANPDAATTLTLDDVSKLDTSYCIAGKGCKVTSFAKINAVNTATNSITLSSGTIITTTLATKLFMGPVGTSTFKFNGATYVTIDGVSRTDASTGLTIQNPNAINAQTILFTNLAQYNTIKNCIIRGANVTGQNQNGYQGTIYFNGGTFTTISHNDICDMNDPNIPFPMTAFQVTAAGGLNNNITISDNNIYNISNQYSPTGLCTFMQLGSEGSSANNSVLRNRFFFTAPVIFSTAVNLINCGTLSDGNLFENNIFGYGAADGTGRSNITTISGGAINVVNNIKNFTCKNNVIAAIDVTGKSFYGLNLATVNLLNNPDDYCYGNTVTDITVSGNATGASIVGIQVSAANAYAYNVKNNVVSSLTLNSTTAANTCSVTGITVTGNPVGATALSYINNKVSNLTAGDMNSSAANIVVGIQFNGGAVALDRNLVYNLYAINTGTNATIRGIYATGSNPTATLISNNIVRVGTYVTNDAVIVAFYQGAATTGGDPCKIYNNTFYVGGQSPAAAIKGTYAFYHTGISQTLDIQNNIIANMRILGNTNTASTEAHYAIQIPTATAPSISTCNHNIYQFAKYFGNIESINAADMATWASAFVTAPDVNSLVADPKFVNSETLVPDMRIQATSPAKAAGTNLLTFVPKDYNGFTRTVSDIGAMAFGTVSEVATVREAELNLYSTNNAIVFSNFAGKTASIYSVSGQLIKSALLSSDNENVSVNKGFYIVRVGSQAGKVLVK